MIRLQVQPLTATGEPGEAFMARGAFTLTPLTMEPADLDKLPGALRKWKIRSAAQDAPTRRQEEYLVIRALQRAEQESEAYALSLSSGQQLARCRRLDNSLIVYEV